MANFAFEIPKICELTTKKGFSKNVAWKINFFPEKLNLFSKFAWEIEYFTQMHDPRQRLTPLDKRHVY